MFKVVVFPPTESSEISLAVDAVSIILVKTSRLNKNKRGDTGSLCRSPLEVEKNSVGEPLARTAKEAEKMHRRIHLIHFPPKPILFIT